MRIIENESAEAHANLKKLAKSYQHDESAEIDDLMDQIEIFEE